MLFFSTDNDEMNLLKIRVNFANKREFSAIFEILRYHLQLLRYVLSAIVTPYMLCHFFLIHTFIMLNQSYVNIFQLVQTVLFVNYIDSSPIGSVLYLSKLDHKQC